MKKVNFFSIPVLSIAITLMAIFTISCGGGGSESSSTILLKTSTVRQMSVGDQWVYDVTYSQDGGSAQAGTLIQTILPGTVFNALANTNLTILEDAYTGSIVREDREDYFRQDSAGNVNYYGEESSSGLTLLWITSSPYNYTLYPSPMSTGQSASVTFTVVNDAAFAESWAISATEIVTTGIGELEAYKMLSEGYQLWPNSNDCSPVADELYEEVRTIWYVPGLGVVKKVVDAMDTCGVDIEWTLHLEYLLQSTNVSY